MNRTEYFNYIEKNLGTLAYRINEKGRLNILDLHIHSENFYADLFNELFGWHLENINPTKQNVEGIDLIDHANKFIIQVSATNTKIKVESALAKNILTNYPEYTFKFICISKDASELRKSTFLNPNSINFNPITDIFDNKSILNFILTLKIDKQKSVYNLVKKELGCEIDICKMDSNLASIINILSKEDLCINNNTTVSPFAIERKIEHNELKTTKSIIEQYFIYHTRLDDKYTEFDNAGYNKSLSVLQLINTIYIDSCVKNKDQDSDFIFLQILEKVKEKVLISANFKEIPIDELELCINIIVVDAFIRCKIFENPQDYDYVATR